MSRWFLKKKRNPSSSEGEPFNKERIIQEIKEGLQPPWAWYKISERMPEYSQDEHGKVIPNFDIVITRQKEVVEHANLSENVFSATKSVIKSVYSITLGVRVVDEFSSTKKFDTTNEFVTAVIEVNSWLSLKENLIKIDCLPGGIRNGS